MYLLGSLVLYFLVCLYTFILEMYLLWFGVSITLLALVYNKSKKYLLYYLVIPILALSSVAFYFHEKIPADVTVQKVYHNRLLVKDGFRLFWMESSGEPLQEGDRLMGQFHFASPGDKEQGVIASLIGSDIAVYSDFLGRFRAYKEKITAELVRTFGEHNGGLMGSLVLGNQRYMNEERARNMKDLGIMHILSISGFHFGLLEGALKKLKLKKITPLVLITYGVFLNSIPGYRTILSLIYRSSGKLIKRDTNAVSGIFISMFVQAFFNPYYIFKQGYLLTYLSTLGILIFYEYFLKHMMVFPKFMRSSVALTCSALFLSFPIILSFSPDFSLGVFIVNFILVPLYSLITYFSFIGVIATRFPLVQIIIRPFIESFFLLSFYTGNFFSSYSSSINLEYLTMYYAPIVVLLYLMVRFEKKYTVLILVTIIMSLSLPFGTSISIYNNYGIPYIRVIHNFRKYDMMDYRIAEQGFIPLRGEVSIMLDESEVKLKPHTSKKGVPMISIDENELRIPKELLYYRGVKKEHYFIFWRNLVYKVY